MEVDEIKHQIATAKQAVEDLAEPLKTQAFGIILSKLLDEIIAEKRVPIGEAAFLGEEVPLISGADSCREAIAKLFASDWGRKPRNIRQIIDAMKLNAIYYPDTNVAVELSRMTKIGLLRRLRDQKGFTYVSAKPAPT